MARQQIAPTDEQKRRRNDKSNERRRNLRTDPARTAKFIILDTKDRDRRRGLENDLSFSFVDDLIKDGCSYCGETSIKMTVDRIDNDKGHRQDNVVPACYRCNMLRGNMPYDAWLNIVPAIRDTLVKGLFESWVGFGPWAKRHQAGG
jgi:hypothetical protein